MKKETSVRKDAGFFLVTDAILNPMLYIVFCDKIRDVEVEVPFVRDINLK